MKPEEFFERMMAARESGKEGEVKRRLPTGHTRGPWPCCGKECEEWPGRLKNRICDECKRLITIGKDAVRRHEAGSMEPYRWTGRHYAWTGYALGVSMAFDGRNRLQRAMWSLVSELAIDAHDERGMGAERGPVLDAQKDSYGRFEFSTRVKMTPHLRGLLNDLDVAIRAALTDVHQAGIEQGRSALVQLADGKMTLDDFDRRTGTE